MVAASLQFALGATPAAAASAALPTCAPSIATGSFFSLAVKSDGTVWSFGSDNSFQLGNDPVTSANQSSPVKVLGLGGTGQLSGVVGVAAGGNASLALAKDGSVYAWGQNSNGQSGDNKAADPTKVPVKVHGPGDVGFLANIVGIAEGRYHSLALKNDGTVWAWGRNLYGQVGDNTNTDANERDTPVQVHGPGDSGFLTGVVAVGAGNYSSYALKADGTVWGWGLNDNGQLGDNTITERDTPVQVHGPGDVGMLTNIIQIAPQRHQVTALRNDGTLWAWGSDTDGELGNGDTTKADEHTPVQVVGEGGTGFLTGVVSVGEAGHHTMAVKANGEVWDYGRNSNGQLGDDKANGNTAEITPVHVKGLGGTGFLGGVESLIGGDHFGLAVRNDGSLAGWGENFAGQLGDASTTERDHPVLVDQSTGLTAVAGSCLAVTNVQAASTSCASGVNVTLTGQGFLGATSVKFGSTEATSFKVVNDQRIDAVSPTDDPGRTLVTVTTPRGTSVDGEQSRTPQAVAPLATTTDHSVCAAVIPTLPKAGGPVPLSPLPGLVMLALALLLGAGTVVQLNRRSSSDGL
jgi:alpha-tubulin suppressor-like RCC1 family protein